MPYPAAILFVHGFLSSAEGTKSNYLREKMQHYPDLPFHAIDLNPTPRDFEFMTVTGEINRLRQYILMHNLALVSLIGSSLGGQVALHYAHRYGGVTNLLLLAPALHYSNRRYPEDELSAWATAGQRLIWHDAFQREVPLRYQFHLDRLHYAEPPPPPAPTVIIHGRNDDVVPLAGSQQYAAQHHAELVQLIEVDSDHRLADQLALIWEQLQANSLSSR